MAKAALKLKSEGHHVIADFVAPTPEARSLFPADCIIWMDTIKESRFDDTNKMFEKPAHCHFEITNFDYQDVIKEIRDKL